MQLAALALAAAAFVSAAPLSPSPDPGTATGSPQQVAANEPGRVAEAERLLAAGRFGEALAEYDSAVKSDPQNQDLKQQCAVLRQVIRMRELRETVKDAEKRQEMATALRAFYYDHALHAEAAKLDEQVFAERHDAASASNLAESRLELEHNRAAIDVLTALPVDQQSLRARVLLVIAMRREGMKGEAAALANKVEVPAELDSGLAFELACMYGTLGDAKNASALLARSLESTRPSAIQSARLRAMARDDLRILRDDGSLATILTVDSKVAESSCSGTTSCAGCPSASKCSGATQTTAAPSDGPKQEK